MLRITLHDSPELLTFQVEGTLAEPLVQELERCWKTTCSADPGRARQIDLAGVTYVDESGKKLLAALHAQGAKFVCAGCRMRAIVAEIAIEN
jgi:anti-anti-sigma regulatory factor